MEKHFMLDIESTGINPEKEDLLSVGILEVDLVDGYWRPGRSFEELQFTSRQPESEFAKKHMAALYERCNQTQPITPETLREKVVAFFESCGAKTPDAYIMGWNASNFDVPFLIAKGVLKPSEYVSGPDGKDVRVGDFHYRIYELGGAVSIAQNVLGYFDRSALLEDAKAADPITMLPKGKSTTRSMIATRRRSSSTG
jgi:hypothetical protein